MSPSPPVTHLPRLIHQTWKHAHLRGPLRTCAESFRKWNLGWEYCFWTDEQCLELIREELPEFLATYLAYPKGIFRADIFRVVVLYLRGGVYADLDVECQRPLDELLAAVGDEDWEVLLARDHPAHERLHWTGRAMWMNDFMVAKPGSRFFRTVMDRLTGNLRRGKPFDDVVQQTGPGLFSTVVEAALSGVTGLGIRPLPWRWVHPLPNVYVRFPERSAYKSLILRRTWREGEQVPLGDDDEDDPARGGPPFVAHYWWHSYIEDCDVVNMLLKYADALLQTDGEIAARRLQKWVPRFGEALDAAGQALARLAERGRNSLCLLVGEPTVRVEADAVSFRALAAEILAGLPMSVRPVTELPEPEMRAAANGSVGTALRGEVSLLAVDLTGDAGERLERVAKLLGAGLLHPGAGVLLLGGNPVAAESFANVLQQAGLACETNAGGWLWLVPEAGGIPKTIHVFASEMGLSRIENEVLVGSWRRHHEGGEWTVKTWTQETVRGLIGEDSPDFLDSYLAYPDDAMRWGAARYFILRREGGVVVKPGTLCLRNLGDIFAGKTAWLVARSGTGKDARHEMLSDAVMASVAGHAFWAHIEQDLESNAKGGHSRAVGCEFLTTRARECSRFLAREHWPAICGSELFDLAEWPEETDTRVWARRARRESCAMAWERVPISMRVRFLQKAEGGGQGMLAEADSQVDAVAEFAGRRFGEQKDATDGERECLRISESGSPSRAVAHGMNIGIPAINRGDLLEACVRSVDFPVERMLIVANKWGPVLEPSVARALENVRANPPPGIGSLEIEEMPGNLGVAGAYNHILRRLGPCVIACNDTRFAPGTLGRCAEFIAERRDHALHFLWAMCVFSVTQVFLDEVGWFDENFWPWGWDDIDVGYRMKKRGLKTAIAPHSCGQIFHDHPTQSIFSSPDALRKWMLQMSAKNTEYGIRKWGIREEYFFMLHPENQWLIDPAVLRDAGNGWNLDIETRRQRIALLRKEVGIETPLLFCRSDGV